jgi:predicted nucleotidyltransferase
MENEFGVLPLFHSPAQAKLLRRIFFEPEGEPESLSALARWTEIPLSTVQREVNVLEQAGLVSSNRIGNTRLVTPNRESPYYRDLASLLLTAFGPTAVLGSVLRRVPRIDQAYIYGSWARRYLGEASQPPRDIDVLVVGEPSPDAVYSAARRAEGELNMEVNPVLASPGEWTTPRGLLRRIKSGPLVELDVS